MSDEKINHQQHYGGDVKFEAIKLILDWGLGFCAGNALKYIIRAPRKGTYRQDLQKAEWYLQAAIDAHLSGHDTLARSRRPQLLSAANAAAFWYPEQSRGRVYPIVEPYSSFLDGPPAPAVERRCGHVLGLAIVELAKHDFERALYHVRQVLQENEP